MSASLMTSLRLFGAAGILAITAFAAAAQTGPESQPAAAPPAAAAPKPDKAAKPKPAAPSGYATEAEAKAHCKGSVVWVDQDHFNHYPGSREYGKKPGAFACEKG